MKKNKGIVVLLLTAIITVFLCYTAGIGLGPTGTGSAKNIKTGLDLSGGVSITYQAKESNPSAEDMSDTVCGTVQYRSTGVQRRKRPYRCRDSWCYRCRCDSE